MELGSICHYKNGLILKYLGHLPSTYIQRALNDNSTPVFKPTTKIYWIGPTPIITKFTSNKKGKLIQKMNFIFSTLQEDFSVIFNQKEGVLIKTWLEQIKATEKLTITQLESDLEMNQLGSLKSYISNQNFAMLRDIGLLIL